MARVLSGGRRKDQLPAIEKEQVPSGQSDSFSLPRTVGATASRAFESLGGLPGNVLSLGLGAANYLTGGRTPTYEEFQKDRPLAPRTSSQIRSATKELTGGALEPKNKVEQFIGDVGEDLPLYLLSGGALLPSLGKTVTSNAARTAARESGVGEVGQALAGIAGGVGFDAIHNKSAIAKLRPKNIKDIAKKEMSSDYETAGKLSKNLRQNAVELEKNIGAEVDKLYSASGLPSRKEKEVINQLHKALDNVALDQINVKNAWDLKKHFNKLARDEANSTAKNYYEFAAKELNKVLQGAGSAHPEFGKAFNRAEDLYIALNGQSAVREILEKNTDLKKLLNNPVAVLSALGGLTGASAFGYGTHAIASLPISVALRQGARAFDFLKRPAANQLFKQLASEAFEGDKVALANTLRRFNEEADQFDQENPEVPEQKMGKVLKGGRKLL